MSENSDKDIWIVHCAAEAFRRAGIVFCQGANELDPSVLSDAQLAAIETEPELTVEKPDGGKSDSGQGKKTGGAPGGKTAHPPKKAR